MKGIDITDKYVRIRVKQPRRFHTGSFRTHDFGSKGHSKRIAGILKRGNEWSTQSYLIPKADLRQKRPKTLKLLNRIKQRYGINVKPIKKLYDIGAYRNR